MGSIQCYEILVIFFFFQNNISQILVFIKKIQLQKLELNVSNKRIWEHLGKTAVGDNCEVVPFCSLEKRHIMV